MIIDTIGAEGIAPDVAWKVQNILLFVLKFEYKIQVNDVETATENHVLLRNK